MNFQLGSCSGPDSEHISALRTRKLILEHYVDFAFKNYPCVLWHIVTHAVDHIELENIFNRSRIELILLSLEWDGCGRFTFSFFF